MAQVWTYITEKIQGLQLTLTLLWILLIIIFSIRFLIIMSENVKQKMSIAGKHLQTVQIPVIYA